MLYLAYKHHIHEVILEEVFSITIGALSGPEIILFKHFKTYWSNIAISDYKPRGRSSCYLRSTVERENYCEVLELTLLLLGGVPCCGVPCCGVKLMKPGGMHHAQFMPRLIYVLKIFMFRGAGFKLSKQELNGLEVSWFLCHVSKSWFLCHFPASESFESDEISCCIIFCTCKRCIEETM